MKTGWAHPILSVEATKALEQSLFAGDEKAEWAAMQAAGRAVASGVLEDFEEIGVFPEKGTVLILAGKGHNAGDALLAAAHVLNKRSQARADIWLVFGSRALRPLALRCWQHLQTKYAPRIKLITQRSLGEAYDLCLDGVFGFQFRPPIDARVSQLLKRVNSMPVRFRAAVDLPSGGDDPAAFRADFTYATGVLKSPLLEQPNAGRLRYLDLGFFARDDAPENSSLVITERILDPLRGWRPTCTDKRKQGHLFVVAGSRAYPGAALMTVMAALRSGAGLVTAFVPESLVPAFAAQVPEAIWVGWPETPDGGLALEGRHLLRARTDRASALVIGPGLGREPETLRLAAEIVESSAVPVLVDADALQSEVIKNASAPLVLTPHAGEYARLAGNESLQNFAKSVNATVLLKGPVTRISAGAEIYHSLFGGPVLARGGSGDLLAGIIGAQLALTPGEVLTAVCRGAVWHGRSADSLARKHGAVAVRTTQLLDFLDPALRM